MAESFGSDTNVEREETILLNCLKYSDQVPEEDFDFLRIVLSLYTREEYDDDDLRNLLSNLKQRNWVEERSGAVFLLDVGETIADRTEDLPTRESFHNLRGRYNDDPLQFREEIMEQVSSELEYSGNRIIDNDPDSLITSAILGQVSGTVTQIDAVSKAYLDCDTYSDREDLMEDSLDDLESAGFTVFGKARDSNMTFLTTSDVDEQRVESVLDAPEITVAIQDFSELEPGIKEFLVREELNSALKDSGLTKIKNKLVDYRDPDRENTRIGEVKRFDAFKFEPNAISGTDDVLVWIEPTSLLIYSVQEFVDYYRTLTERRDDTDDESVEEMMEGLDVRVLPRKTDAEIDKVYLNLEDGIEDSQIDSIASLKEYWSDRYNIETDPKYLVRVDFGDGFTMTYPADTLQVDKEEIEQRIGSWEEFYPATSPTERRDRIRDINDDWFSYLRPVVLDEITLDNDLISVADLQDIGFVQESGRIKPPQLLFSEKDASQVSSDPRKIFDYGGLGGKEDIHLSKIFVPSDTDNQEIIDFLAVLTNAYDDINDFGQLNHGSATDMGVRYPKDLLENPDAEKFGNLVEQRKSEISGLVLVLVPNQNNRFRAIAKQQLLDKLDVKDQAIRVSTFEDVASGDFALAKNLALQLYIKGMDGDREVPWILSKPSDLEIPEVQNTAYVGLSFSRKDDRTANSFIGICNNRGRRVIQQLEGIRFSGDRFIDQNWVERFFEIIKHRINDSTPNNSEKIDRLVVYKRGFTYDFEIENFQEHIQQLQEEGAWSGVDIDLVSVREYSTGKRLFRDINGINNSSRGNYVVLDEREAILIASEAHQGTAVPLTIEKETPSDATIEQLLQEYFDRIYLNWGAPITLSKWSIELTLSKNLSELAAEVNMPKSMNINYIFV